MTKKTLNQNAKYAQELLKAIEPDFIFNDKPINNFVIKSFVHFFLLFYMLDQIRLYK